MDWETVDRLDDDELLVEDDEWVEFPDHDSLNTLFNTINSESFKIFAHFAYKNPEGVAFRTNPDTGKKEMFVAGTRSSKDWSSNITEYIGNYRDGMWRTLKQEELAERALKEKVEIVYGHSRGGALVADMQIPSRIQKVGLDAAMILAVNKDMLNLTESGTGAMFSSFDKAIGQTGKYNVSIDYSPYHYHKVWRM